MATKGEAYTSIVDPPSWLDLESFPFQNRRVKVLKHDIHYIDEGTGPTLLLLHGNGSWSYGFRQTIPKYTPHFRVVALDYPGMGLSKAKPGYSYLPEEQSNVVESFVDMMGLHDIRLLVEDWGGPIGIGLATRRPDLFHSIVITNTWCWPAQGSPAMKRFSKTAGSFVGTFLITQFNVLARFAVPNTLNRKMTPAEVRGYWMPYPDSQSRQAMAVFPREILHSKDYLARCEAGLKKLVGKPILIVWGEKDPGFGDAEYNRWLTYFDYADTRRLPNAKHYVSDDEPEAVATAVIDFEKKNNSWRVTN